MKTWGLAKKPCKLVFACEKGDIEVHLTDDQRDFITNWLTGQFIPMLVDWTPPPGGPYTMFLRTPGGPADSLP
jgi:hypothetical protein